MRSCQNLKSKSHTSSVRYQVIEVIEVIGCQISTVAVVAISDRFCRSSFMILYIFKDRIGNCPYLERLVPMHVIPTAEVGSTSQCDCFKTSLQTTSRTATNWGEEFAASFHADSGEVGMILHGLQYTLYWYNQLILYSYIFVHVLLTDIGLPRGQSHIPTLSFIHRQQIAGLARILAMVCCNPYVVGTRPVVCSCTNNIYYIAMYIMIMYRLYAYIAGQLFSSPKFTCPQGKHRVLGAVQRCCRWMRTCLSQLLRRGEIDD